MTSSIQSTERAIASKIVDDAIAAGYMIEVHDGRNFTLTYGEKREEILGAMFSTDADTLFFYKPHPSHVQTITGFIHLIYGSGHDVIADASGNAAMADLLARAEKFSAELQEAEARALRVGKVAVYQGIDLNVLGEIAPGLFFCRNPEGDACLHDGKNFRGYIERADGKRFRIRVWGPLGSAKRGDCSTGLYFTESGAERALMRIGKELHTKPASAEADPLEEIAGQAASELFEHELAAAGGLN
jgi:hypothetical protein